MATAQPLSLSDPYMYADIKQTYAPVIDRVLKGVRVQDPGKCEILSNYVATVIKNGAELSPDYFQELAQKTHDEIEEKALAVKDKLSQENRDLFAQAAEERSPEARHDALFASKQAITENEITLPLKHGDTVLQKN